MYICMLIRNIANLIIVELTKRCSLYSVSPLFKFGDGIFIMQSKYFISIIPLHFYLLKLFSS